MNHLRVVLLPSDTRQLAAVAVEPTKVLAHLVAPEEEPAETVVPVTEPEEVPPARATMVAARVIGAGAPPAAAGERGLLAIPEAPTTEPGPERMQMAAVAYPVIFLDPLYGTVEEEPVHGRPGPTMPKEVLGAEAMLKGMAIPPTVG